MREPSSQKVRKRCCSANHVCARSPGTPRTTREQFSLLGVTCSHRICASLVSLARRPLGAVHEALGAVFWQ